MYKLIKNPQIINENKTSLGSVLVKEEKISQIISTHDLQDPEYLQKLEQIIQEFNPEIIEAEGLHLIPGVIDTQVHFRDPGLTHKGDLATETAAALAGGVTTVFEMPNTVPRVLTQDLLEEKNEIAAAKSLCNYSFYMGTSNENIDEVLKTDPSKTCGIKIFMGASTGNMLVDNLDTLEKVFAEAPTLIATHCEHEQTIREASARAMEQYGEEAPISEHPNIRSREACYKSTKLATDLARKYGTRLHVLHLSTAEEMELFDADIPLEDKRITAEACVHHLSFCSDYYKTRGPFIRWNPAIKNPSDKAALWHALLNNRLDLIATDHAPHTFEEKSGMSREEFEAQLGGGYQPTKNWGKLGAKLNYFKTAAGGPLVQHSLIKMLEFYHEGKISLETIVHKMCHAPAMAFKIRDRGYIREGYQADLALVDLNAKPWEVTTDNILYKCNWSPFEGDQFKSKVIKTFVNGHCNFDLDSQVKAKFGQRVLFHN